jgi:hypothetical protein
LKGEEIKLEWTQILSIAYALPQLLVVISGEEDVPCIRSFTDRLLPLDNSLVDSVQSIMAVAAANKNISIFPYR